MASLDVLDEGVSLYNTDGELLRPGIFHALLVFRAKDPKSSKHKRIVVDLCWKLRTLDGDAQEFTDGAQNMFVLNHEGARLPSARPQQSRISTKWKLKSGLTIGRVFQEILDLQEHRQRNPWNPKYNNCHDFCNMVLPQMVAPDAAVDDVRNFLENGLLNTRCQSDRLFGGGCWSKSMSKLIEVYVRYFGGCSGSRNSQPLENPENVETLLYSGYNRHPLQQAADSASLCPASWDVIEVAIVFRKTPCPQWSLTPLGVTPARIQADYDSKCAYIKSVSK